MVLGKTTKVERMKNEPAGTGIVEDIEREFNKVLKRKPEAPGTDFTVVISKVKEGILEAQKRGVFDPAWLPLKSLTLTLKTVVEVGVGGAFKITVPVQIGVSASRQQQNTQTIVITLVPPQAPSVIKDMAISKREQETIENSLVKSLVAIHEGVQAGLVGDPPFVPDNATVELNFGVTEEGEIEVVLQASAEIENTNSLKLELGKTKSESGKLELGKTRSESGKTKSESGKTKSESGKP